MILPIATSDIDLNVTLGVFINLRIEGKEQKDATFIF